MNHIEDFRRVDLTPLASLLESLLRPIITECVAEAVSGEFQKRKDMNRYLTVKQVNETYGISASTLYQRFRTGKLKKVKNGGLTFVDREDLERTMIPQLLCGKKPFKP